MNRIVCTGLFLAILSLAAMSYAFGGDRNLPSPRLTATTSELPLPPLSEATSMLWPERWQNVNRARTPTRRWQQDHVTPQPMAALVDAKGGAS